MMWLTDFLCYDSRSGVLTCVENDQLIRSEFACDVLPECLKVGCARNDLAVAMYTHQLRFIRWFDGIFTIFRSCADQERRGILHR